MTRSITQSTTVYLSEQELREINNCNKLFIINCISPLKDWNPTNCEGMFLNVQSKITCSDF